MTSVVGICAAIESISWGVWSGVTADLAPRSYAAAVQRSGALAVLLPAAEAAIEEPDPLLDRLDALLLSGGADVDPSSYGAEAHPETRGTWPERDRFEIALARRAVDRDLPVLGICRGMQILNVSRGGTLCQHLPELLGHERHRPVPGRFEQHEVELEPGSLARQAAGADRLSVRSHHHQGLERLGEDLVVSGRAVGEDVIEAIELPGRRFALGVHWHPEEDVNDRVVAALVEAARAEVPR